MNAESLPHEALRRQLAAIGILPERQHLRALVELLPAQLDRRVYDEMSADTVAEVLIYLVGKKVLSVPPAAPAAPELAWGEHLCRPYRSQDELLGLVVPYLTQGLKRNERCLWVARPAVASQIVRQANGRAHDLREAGDQLEIVEVLADWQREEARALAEGYSGLRISLETGCAQAEMQAAISVRRIKVLCTHRIPDERT